jgi:hypothetical protein
MMNENQLIDDVAYRSMFCFLEDHYRRTGCDVIGGMLSDLSILEDGGPGDPAVTEDWAKAVERARLDVESIKFRIVE